MKTLKGIHINLRPLEPEDLQFLYDSENDEINWKISGTQVPYSKFILKNYIENSSQDIYEAKQLRLIIEDKKTKEAIGMIDLFDLEPLHRRAGIGILILNQFRNKKFASEALHLLISYAFHYLNLHQLFANITTDNKNSIRLFEKFNFQLIGIKKDWVFYNKKFHNESTYQLIHSIERDHE
ncbi:GNAT family N-acetyltransferase [Flavicella sp.]|uniref:GNAT family N-acetyltransferase n=1 Tax=Flavicella sp. TaxID=2957742 RepID=UPI0030162B67